MTGEPLLCARGLTWEISGRKIIEGIEISVGQGETVALLGPNGAGKTTLLKKIALLEEITTGEIYLQGEKISWRDISARRRLALVLQEPVFFTGSVYYNLQLPLRLRGAAAGEIRAKVENWAERFGISHLLPRDARHLSGGEARKVALIRALIGEPLVLLLDEPFTGLDFSARRELMALLREIKKEGVGILYTTHHLPEVLPLADRAVVMMAGRIVQTGPPVEIVRYPVPEFAPMVADALFFLPEGDGV